ncbi:MAG: class I SAM-dependent methyltransferase [Alphaproteobacteria bacterium]|nr:class I SAM-dependent methyltransferase [Alphaproteobacteria bacterium]MDD9919892.1 class I SAM-dependent methyltransferase [Alphaproteobacteria bacterium]
MKLSSFEKNFVNSSLRSKIQQPRAMNWFLNNTSLHQGCDVLEVGCGCGHGLELIHKKLQPNDLTGIDFDTSQVNLALKNTRELTPQPKVRQGDAAALPFYETSFHVVFNFGAIHHVPDWHRAVNEVARVLRPGGYFLCEEIYRSFLQFPIIRNLFNYPAERFSHAELLLALQQAGLTVVKERKFVGSAYGLIIARKDV